MSKGAVPLAIVPPIPCLSRRRSSLLSGASSPRTPRSCGSPTGSSIYLSSSKRKSTDSWNSSNQDFGDDIDVDWIPEQILFLQRTLDALPAHLLTPFNGGVPPPNLLDKIARKVGDAKNAVEWPHSHRATRAKLLEIARQRATEDSRLDIVGSENGGTGLQHSDAFSLGNKKANGLKRPIYRQSSMDFLNTANDSDSISRLSARLQHADRVITNLPRPRRSPRLRAQANARDRDRRSPSPPPPVNVPSLISPSSPSSSTLNSLSSFSAYSRPRYLRRSASTISSLSTDSLMSCSGNGSGDNEPVPRLAPPLPTISDRRIQRVRRSESFYEPSSTKGSMSFSIPSVSATPAPVRQSFKRAPSFGALAQEAKGRGSSFASGYGVPSAASSKYSLEVSSDEEERIRSRGAKKARTRDISGTATPPCQEQSGSSEDSSMRLRPRRSLVMEKKRSSTSSASMSSVIDENSPGPNIRRKNLQRNPSIYGKELPHLHIPSSSNSKQPAGRTPIASPDRLNRPLPEVPTDEAVSTVTRTLRRVGRIAAPAPRPSRKISFNSLTPPMSGEDADTEPEVEADEQELGSAFQLQ